MMDWEFSKIRPLNQLIGKFIPQELIGRVVKDAYTSNAGSFIEFECGTIVDLGSNYAKIVAQTVGRQQDKAPKPPMAKDYILSKRKVKKI